MKRLENHPVLFVIAHFAIVILGLAAFLGLAVFAEWFASII